MKYSVFLYRLRYDGYYDYSIINRDRGLCITEGTISNAIIDKVYYTIDDGIKICYQIEYYELTDYSFFKYLFKLIKHFENNIIYDDCESYNLDNFKSYVIEINEEGYV